jgi:hypothetical protein
MSSAPIVSPDAVDRTINAFTRLDQKGDKKAMGKLAARLQREQPFLLQYAARLRGEHGDTVGEAAVFYATLVWSMYDRLGDDTLPRLTQGNLDAAEKIVTEALAADPSFADKAPYERTLPTLMTRQPHIFAKLRELLEEDVREAAMTAETCAAIIVPTQVVVEAFDAALAGTRPGQAQGTVAGKVKVGRNDKCPCGSDKKYKKCHGAAA